MATRTVKARVELDGEKEYKQAIAELNKGNQVLASEMKKLASEYKGNETSMEALTAKGDLLQRQLLQQKDKVQTLREALADAAKEYGEADTRTQNWQIQLNKAEAAQIDLEHAIEENNEAVENQGEEMTSLGDSVQTVADKLGIRLPEGAKKALDSMKGFSAGTVAAMGAAAAAVAALIKAGKELHQLTLDAAAQADTIITDSVVNGLGTDTLQVMQYAENLIDVSADTIKGSLTKLTNAIYDAANGNKTLAATFETLGVSTTNADGSLRGAEEVFYEVIDALGGVGNETERNALAMDLMGKSAQELNPLIMQGSGALKELADEAKKTGYVLSEDQIKVLGEVDDAYQKMELQIEATKKQLALEFAPASKTAMETFSTVVQKAGKTLTDTRLIENLGAIVQGVMGIVDAGTDFAGAIPGWMNPIQQFSNALRGLAVVAATVADAINLISGLMPWNWGSGKASTALGLNLRNGQMSNLQQLKYSSGDYVTYNAAGTQNWRGGLTWVGESGPELVALPQGSRIYSNQESRAAGGDTIYNITVANIEELDEIIDWYESRRIRERMG